VAETGGGEEGDGSEGQVRWKSDCRLKGNDGKSYPYPRSGQRMCYQINGAGGRCHSGTQERQNEGTLFKHGSRTKLRCTIVSKGDLVIRAGSVDEEGLGSTHGKPGEKKGEGNLTVYETRENPPFLQVWPWRNRREVLGWTMEAIAKKKERVTRRGGGSADARPTDPQCFNKPTFSNFPFQSKQASPQEGSKEGGEELPAAI